MSNYNDQVELGGLGYHVLSTDIAKVTDHLGKEIVHHTYKARSGTSMAAPLVAAAAATGKQRFSHIHTKVPLFSVISLFALSKFINIENAMCSLGSASRVHRPRN